MNTGVLPAVFLVFAIPTIAFFGFYNTIGVPAYLVNVDLFSRFTFQSLVVITFFLAIARYFAFISMILMIILLDQHLKNKLKRKFKKVKEDKPYSFRKIEIRIEKIRQKVVDRYSSPTHMIGYTSILFVLCLVVLFDASLNSLLTYLSSVFVVLGFGILRRLEVETLASNEELRSLIKDGASGFSKDPNKMEVEFIARSRVEQGSFTRFFVDWKSFFVMLFRHTPYVALQPVQATLLLIVTALFFGVIVGEDRLGKTNSLFIFSDGFQVCGKPLLDLADEILILQESGQMSLISDFRIQLLNEPFGGGCSNVGDAF